MIKFYIKSFIQTKRKKFKINLKKWHKTVDFI